MLLALLWQVTVFECVAAFSLSLALASFVSLFFKSVQQALERAENTTTVVPGYSRALTICTRFITLEQGASLAVFARIPPQASSIVLSTAPLSLLHSSTKVGIECLSRKKRISSNQPGRTDQVLTGMIRRSRCHGANEVHFHNPTGPATPAKRMFSQVVTRALGARPTSTAAKKNDKGSALSGESPGTTLGGGVKGKTRRLGAQQPREDDPCQKEQDEREDKEPLREVASMLGDIGADQRERLARAQSFLEAEIARCLARANGLFRSASWSVWPRVFELKRGTHGCAMQASHLVYYTSTECVALPTA